MPVGLGITIDNVEDFPSTTTNVRTHSLVAGDNLYVATYYNSQNDYQRFEAMLEEPVVYEAEIDLSVLDLEQYSPFNLANVAELGGLFYVNKLQYNFEKSGKASKVTLIKYVSP